MKTRITELLGIEHPIFQAAMSWASSNSQLVMAVSNAGGLGVIERLAGLGYEAALQLGAREASSTRGAFWIFPIPFVISLMHFWWDGFVWSVQRKEV